MRRILLSIILLFGLAACAAESKWASTEEVTRATYVHNGPPMISLFTVVGRNNGQGGHAALMINGSQRILFDPAGTWYHPQIPERNDVHFGISEPAVEFYIDYHARITWDVYRHDIIVSPAVAEKAIRLVQEYGAVPKAMCTQAVTAVLRQLPGFESIGSTLFPVAAMKDFKALPGVTERFYQDDDPNDNDYILAPHV
ncbi:MULTISPECIES: hypothetical protein [Maritimibacter]|jgi:hypothetical protein|uniref:Lipoprotein n=1 Tax=Maritimibacter alkaliphilus HTCC2654 TaxID=314271 RepID=A3VCI7_9RHOB|nr:MULTISPECIES: hypothetical protein [Maritimibacter]EAQ13853.1 hypothetical protein RB2654_12309 [Maritimibacter alkaliphilus HTCC2654]MBL6427677.1 hypothetical protein [Maritimibacter sp.]TYP84050.1 hypothetical protein BD830_102139 [Maritimibacter alkaliphilus HTCC2654]